MPFISYEVDVSEDQEIQLWIQQLMRNCEVVRSFKIALIIMKTIIIILRSLESRQSQIV